VDWTTGLTFNASHKYYLSKVLIYIAHSHKTGGIASEEEVILQLVESKCISSLLYGLEACGLNQSSPH